MTGSFFVYFGGKNRGAIFVLFWWIFLFFEGQKVGEFCIIWGDFLGGFYVFKALNL
jgi:hypothetical protein